MRAKVGDWVVVERVRLGEPRRTGEIVEVRHSDGSPPYLVRWAGQEQATLVFPGPDARIEPRAVTTHHLPGDGPAS
jgi:hypothetical protein